MFFLLPSFPLSLLPFFSSLPPPPLPFPSLLISPYFPYPLHLSLSFSLSHFLSLFITVPYNYLLDVHFFLLVYLFHKNRACVSCVYCSTPHLEQRLLYHKPLEGSSRGNLSNCKLTEQFDLAHFYWTLGFTCSLLFDPGLLLSYFLETDPRQIACRSHLMCSFHF